MNLPARGRAAGRVILLGDHAVAYGRPALAAGLGLGVEVEVTAGNRGPQLESDRCGVADDPRLARMLEGAAAALGLEPVGFDVSVRSDLPPGLGLGSSAAVVVAVLRAFAATTGRRLGCEVEFALGRRLETIFHGPPSDIDPVAAALGSCCFRFVRGDPPTVTRLRTARPLFLVVALAGVRRRAAATADGLRARWEMERPHYERLFDDVAAVVEEGVRAAEAGDLPRLGHAFDRNHDLLRALGMSAPRVERLVAAARAAGALGAKLTGDRGGGVLALATEPERVAASLRARGIEPIVVHVAAREEPAT